mgnify:CR=1 FL=1
MKAVDKSRKYTEWQPEHILTLVANLYSYLGKSQRKSSSTSGPTTKRGEGFKSWTTKENNFA